MTLAKEIDGVTLGFVRLYEGSHASFVLGKDGECFCECGTYQDGTPFVMVSHKSIVKEIREISGGDD